MSCIIQLLVTIMEVSNVDKCDIDNLSIENFRDDMIRGKRTLVLAVYLRSDDMLLGAIIMT